MSDKSATAVSKTLTDWVGDVVTLESHIEEAMDRQLKLKSGSQAVDDAIQHFHDTVRDSKHRAVAFQKDFGEVTGHGVQQTAGELLGKAAGLIDKVRKDSVSKSLRDDYVAFNMAAISYTLLYSTALALDDTKTASFAEAGLTTYAGLVQRINAIVPRAVVDDLIKNDDVPVANTGVADRARATIDKAWKSTS